MPNLNKVMIIGHLGRDPEIKYLPSGDPVANFSVAVGEKYKDQEHTEWFSCVAFGKLAEICQKYLVKGAPVYLEGKLKTREYEYQGQKKKHTDVIVNQMQMLGRKDREQAEDKTDEYAIPF